MLITTVTQKGQVTIPIDIRESLGLTVGSKVSVGEKDGEVKLRPVSSLSSFRGILKGKRLPTENELEDIFAGEAMARYKKTLTR